MRILLLTLLSACALSHEPEDIVSSSASEPTSELFHCDAVFDGHTVQYSAQLNYGLVSTYGPHFEPDYLPEV